MGVLLSVTLLLKRIFPACKNTAISRIIKQSPLLFNSNTNNNKSPAKSNKLVKQNLPTNGNKNRAITFKRPIKILGDIFYYSSICVKVVKW